MKKLIIVVIALLLMSMTNDKPEKRQMRFTIFPSDYHEKRAEELIKNFNQ